jgi:uncharacterized protein YozE (UPF0346 family)
MSFPTWRERERTVYKNFNNEFSGKAKSHFSVIAYLERENFFCLEVTQFDDVMSTRSSS